MVSYKKILYSKYDNNITYEKEALSCDEKYSVELRTKKRRVYNKTLYFDDQNIFFILQVPLPRYLRVDYNLSINFSNKFTFTFKYFNFNCFVSLWFLTQRVFFLKHRQ